MEGARRGVAGRQRALGLSQMALLAVYLPLGEAVLRCVDLRLLSFPAGAVNTQEMLVELDECTKKWVAV